MVHFCTENEWLSAKFIYKMAVTVALVALFLFIVVGWPLSMLVY